MGVITSSTEDMELVNISKSSLCSGCVSVHCVLQSHLWKEFCVLWHIFAHYFPQITLQATEREKTLKQYIYYMILHGQNIMILYGQNIYIYSIFSHPFKNQVVQGMRGHLESSHVLPKAPSPCDWSVLWEQCSQIALLAETEQLLHVCLWLFVNAGTQGTFVSDSGVYSPCLRYLPVDWHQLSQSVLSGHHEVPFYDKSANKSVFLTIT